LRFFVNHPKVLDFSVGATLAPSQEVTLSYHDLSGERAIELRSGSFQVVTNVQIFITSGQSSMAKMEIDSMQLFGAPILAAQPDSILSSPPKPVRPTSSSNANSNPQPQSQHKKRPSANDNNSGSDDEPGCHGSTCGTAAAKYHLQEHKKHQRPYSKNHQASNQYASNARLNYTAPAATSQLPGHSKNLIPSAANEMENASSSVGAADRLHRNHHHKPQPGDQDHHHHHSHSRHQQL